MEWLRKRWWVALLYIANLAAAAIAATIIDDAFNDPTFHDVVLATIVIAAVIGPMAYLIIAEIGSSPTTAPAIPAGVGAHAHQTDAPPQQEAEEAPVTGEASISTVSSKWRFKSDELDFYIDDDFYRAKAGGQLVGASDDIAALRSMKLGEMALIRRLAVAPEGQEASRRCVALLRVAGIEHPDSSIAKLEDLVAIETTHLDRIKLSLRGRNLVYLSNQMLMHDAELVSAYRSITPTINTSIRFDGRPLSS